MPILFCRLHLLWRRLLKPIMSLCLFGALTVLIGPASSHMPLDPEGKPITWYPRECCHDRDCQPVVGVRETPEGLWMTMVDGTSLLISSDEPRRTSRDMRWHICLAKTTNRDIVVQCVFEPPSM
jgi:hypothetical protein